MKKFPHHIAIIMDGNGRWAQVQNKPRVYGHIKGARVAKQIITRAVELKISSLTLYTFSTENWSRPIEEVSFLMTLLNRYLIRQRKKLVDQNIKFNVIGDISKLPSQVIDQIKICKEITENNNGLNLTFALNYGGRQEIVEAVKNITSKVKSGNLSIDQINEDLVNSTIINNSVDAPDLLIRTSGELRLSNFLIWQSAYSEFYFTDVLWPEFSVKDLELAIYNFQCRERRFGKVSAQVGLHEDIITEI